MKIDTQYEFGDRVVVKAHQVEGVVNAVFHNRTFAAPQIGVEYTDDNGTIQERYFSEAEIEPATAQGDKDGQG